MKPFPTLYQCLRLIALSVLLSLLGTGCCIIGKDDPRKYNLLVECDEVVAHKTVLVDLIGVTKDDLPTWESYPVTKYFLPGDRMRAGLGQADKFTHVFGEGKPRSFAFRLSQRTNNTTWQGWLNRRVSYLVVIADLPEDTVGGPDPRRKTAPLTCRRWGSTRNLRILVQDTGVRIEPVARLPK